ncbi:hypothetical protein F511_33348 [Dorcoceras hygrometricum]|uniref:Uncharacterized protein n=1 Tax=Dorcoceras hygrometricum TaxID=472368 RepID=A0A2Z7CFS8_9LAMI|nr:hypothetical protein F511_33348 [Dorcoceras hygrometricum]
MMTSACLLEEAMSSKDDVSNISRQLSGNSNDDVSSDVITISNCEEKRKRWNDVSTKNPYAKKLKEIIRRRNETDVARSVVTKKKTTAEQTAVEQIVGSHSAVGMQSTLKIERING